jgi:hypothetical protein
MQAEGDVVRLPVAQKGSLDFATFFADEHLGLFKLLCFVTGDRADAADLMQDAFLKLWERWDRIDRIADPRAYLFRGTRLVYNTSGGGGCDPDHRSRALQGVVVLPVADLQPRRPERNLPTAPDLVRDHEVCVWSVPVAGGNATSVDVSTGASSRVADGETAEWLDAHTLIVAP